LQDDSNWRFLILSDSHLGGTDWGVNNPGRSDVVAPYVDWLSKYLEQKPVDLIIHLGDLTHNGSDLEIAEARRLFGSLPCPVRVLLGNHDVVGVDRAPAWIETWPEAFPGHRPYYAFMHRGVQFICLFTYYEERSGRANPWWVWEQNGGWPMWRIPTEQLAFLDTQLTAHSNLPALIFTHCSPFPLYQKPGRDNPPPLETGAAPLLSVLSSHHNVAATFAGHLHGNQIYQHNGLLMVTSAAMAEYPYTCRLVTVGADHLDIETLTLPEHHDVNHKVVPPERSWPSGLDTDRSCRHPLPLSPWP